jgi:type I restriction enzyme S subunit
MKNWEKKKLGELSKKKDAVVSGPFGSNLKVSDYKNEGIPILRLQNIGKGYFIDKDIKFINEEKAEELKYHSFLSGDIALAKLGIPIGKTCIIPKHLKSGIITADIVRIRPDKKVVDYNFLEYFLNTDLSVNQLTNNISGATRPRVNLSDVRNIEIPLPPLHEQQRIVSILDETFAAISKAKANAEQNLKNAKELFESYLQGVFKDKVYGNKSEALENLCELVVDCEHKTAPLQETGYPSIRTPNIGKGELILDNVNRVSYETYLKWTRRAIPQSGDLILAREAPAGNIAVIPDNIEVCLGQRTVLIRPKKGKLVSKYLAYLILSKEVQEKLLSHSTGATVEHINMKDIRAFKIYNLLPISEQQLVVSKIESLSAETQKLEAIYQQKLLNLEELKKSVLQKAFNGELNNNKN